MTSWAVLKGGARRRPIYVFALNRGARGACDQAMLHSGGAHHILAHLEMYARALLLKPSGASHQSRGAVAVVSVAKDFMRFKHYERHAASVTGAMTNCRRAQPLDTQVLRTEPLPAGSSTETAGR
jgi:hypothetical protein